MKTTYEWTLEWIDKHGDICDSHFSEKLSDVIGWAADRFEDCRAEIGLVRDTHDEFESFVERDWAYVFNGELSTKFQDSERDVPKRFLAEWEKARSEA